MLKNTYKYIRKEKHQHIIFHTERLAASVYNFLFRSSSHERINRRNQNKRFKSFLVVSSFLYYFPQKKKNMTKKLNPGQLTLLSFPNT